MPRVQASQLAIDDRAQLPGGMYEPAWLLVQTWKHGDKELRGEAKLAWWALWAAAGFRPNSITVNVNALASLQGTGNAAGNRYLNTLLAAGLIERFGEPFKGVWHIYVLDPADVLRGIRRADVAPQPSLFEKHEPEVGAPAEPATNEVRSLNVSEFGGAVAADATRFRSGTGAEPARPLQPSELVNKYPSTFNPSDAQKGAAPAPRREGEGTHRGSDSDPRPRSQLARLAGSSAEAARGESERPSNANPIAFDLAQILDVVVKRNLPPSEDEALRWIDHLTTKLRERVDQFCEGDFADQQLKPVIALRVATAIVERRGEPVISRGDLLQCLHHMAQMARKREFKRSPAIYFAARMQNLFRERGEPWR